MSLINIEDKNDEPDIFQEDEKDFLEFIADGLSSIDSRWGLDKNPVLSRRIERLRDRIYYRISNLDGSVFD